MDPGWCVPCPHPTGAELPQPSDRVKRLACWGGGMADPPPPMVNHCLSVPTRGAMVTQPVP